MNRWIITLCAALALTALPSFAQDQQQVDELRKRVAELEQKIASMQAGTASADLEELKRQIAILSEEIEKLRMDREKPAAEAVSQYGLGAAASKVYRSEPGVSIGGYGEMVYENYDSRRDDGPASGKTDQLDFLRAVLYTGYKFNDRVLFNSELEVEHSNTNDGEVSLEFGYLDFLVNPLFNVRAGLLLMPVGLVNELHEPTAFLGARRPDVERAIIPATWREAGAGVFGEQGPLSYRAYLVTGLDSRDFTASGIRSGRQGGAKAKAEDLALVGRLDWKPAEGLLFGGSYYTGNSAQGGDFSGRVSVAEVHGDARIRGLQLRALWADGKIGDARNINLRNGLTGAASVGEGFGGWYAEAGYDVGTLMSGRALSLTPFVRHESFDTQDGVPAGFLENRALQGTVTTLGVVWKPIPQTAVKIDFQNLDNDAGTGVDQFNIGLGYIF